jgi:hypothetical protein
MFPSAIVDEREEGILGAIYKILNHHGNRTGDNGGDVEVNKIKYRMSYESKFGPSLMKPSRNSKNGLEDKMESTSKATNFGPC